MCDSPIFTAQEQRAVDRFKAQHPDLYREIEDTGIGTIRGIRYTGQALVFRLGLLGVW